MPSRRVHRCSARCLRARRCFSNPILDEPASLVKREVEHPAPGAGHALDLRAEPLGPSLALFLPVHHEVTRHTVIGPTGRQREFEIVRVLEQCPGLIAVALAQQHQEQPQRGQRPGQDTGIMHHEAVLALGVHHLADQRLDRRLDTEDGIERRGRERQQFGPPVAIDVGERRLTVRAQFGAAALVLHEVPVVPVPRELQELEPELRHRAALAIQDRGRIGRSRPAGPPRAQARLDGGRERRALHAQVGAAIPHEIADRLHRRPVGIAHQHQHDTRQLRVVHDVGVQAERVERALDAGGELRVLPSQPPQQTARRLPDTFERHDAAFRDRIGVGLPEADLRLGDKTRDRVSVRRRPWLDDRSAGRRRRTDQERERHHGARGEDMPQVPRRGRLRSTGRRSEHGQRIRVSGSRRGQVRTAGRARSSRALGNSGDSGNSGRAGRRAVTSGGRSGRAARTTARQNVTRNRRTQSCTPGGSR